jgi:CDP-diacylglycerol---serine O-phosphatidyltransferase
MILSSTNFSLFFCSLRALAYRINQESGKVKGMKRVYLLPNVITAFGLACGLYVIFKVNMVEPGAGTYQVMLSSAFLLLVAALADFIDGFAARIFKVESEFGLMFDSLADTVSFGVAPSILLLKSLSLSQGTIISFYAVTGAMVFSLCGVLRLVRYSVKAVKTKTDLVEVSQKTGYFTGLPITGAAAAAIAANLFIHSPFLRQFVVLDLFQKAIILASLSILLGYLMVSRWKFPSLKMLQIRIPSFYLVLVTVATSIFLLYGILHFFSFVLAFVSWGYIIISFILSMIRIIAGKKSKTLEGFEREDDDFDELE